MIPRDLAEHWAEYPDEVPALLDSAARRLEWRRRRGGKACSRCGETKPVAAFGADSPRRDGLARYCRSCRSVTP